MGWLRPILRSSDPASGFDQPTEALGPASIAAAGSEPEGAMIGRYKILQRIGEGGFGVVYMAQQTEPIKRRVALKILKPGMDTKQIVGRFEAERQALGMMDHPHIARVLDGGATPSGRPFFVMELVRGEPLNQFADREKLDTRQRIELIRSVALAVQHAHSKGIIHRDLKPTNVLVELTDGKPVPKVIDFGIAKAASIELTDRTVFTDFRQMIGTPEYMSPEQAGGGIDIDTRTDIYSLGVMLYELLTSTTPLDSRKLRSASFMELQRIIREDEPPRPSARLTGLTTLSDVAQRRRTAPQSLAGVLRGELDWIVMKCLEKDRARRYQTVNELVDDLDRYLKGQTVLAAPPSTGYKVRKFVTRYRTAVIAAAAVLIALILGIIGTGIGFVRAQRESARLARASDFLERLVVTGGEGGGNLGPAEVSDLRREAANLFPGKPIGVMVLLARADLLFKRQQADSAVPILSQAVSELEELGNKPLLAGSLMRLGQALQEAREPGKAEPVLARALEVTRDQYGEKSDQYADALTLLLSARVTLARSDPEYRTAAKDTYAMAVKAYRSAYGPENTRTTELRSRFASWLAESAFTDEAQGEFEAVHQAMERTTGFRTMAGMRFMSDYVAFVQRRLNDVRAAAPLYADLVDAASSVLGPGHGQTLAARLGQATMLWRAGRREEAGNAFRLFAEAAAGPQVRVDDSFPAMVATHEGAAADLFERFPRYAAQARLVAFDAARQTREFKPDEYLARGRQAGFALLDSERYPEAERVGREILDLILRTPKRLGTQAHADALVIIGGSRLRQGHASEAEATLRAALTIARRTQVPFVSQRHAPQAWLGEALIRLRRFEEASQLLHGTLISLGREIELPDAIAGGQRLVDLYTAWGKPEDAAQWRQWLSEKRREPGASDPSASPAR